MTTQDKERRPDVERRVKDERRTTKEAPARSTPRGSGKKSRNRFTFALWPLAWCLASTLFFVFHERIHEAVPAVPSGMLSNIGAVAIFYSFGWLLGRSFRAFVSRQSKGTGRRRAPKLLSELVSLTLFTIATMLAIGVMIGRSSGGVLASSGLIIAILGFAIRNVLADILSGIALGLEAPFRIGDWVEFDTDTTGRVTEIGWRSTRILTEDDTYMILPNSQISRQMLTNYSAPRKQYQATVRVTLRHKVPIAKAKTLLMEAAEQAGQYPGMVEKQKPVVRATDHSVEGVTYTIKYWVSNYAYDWECRDAILAAIDKVLRENDALPAPLGVRLVVGEDQVVRAL